jgi:hypothetical protein
VLRNSGGSIWITLSLQGELRRIITEVVAVLQRRCPKAEDGGAPVDDSCWTEFGEYFYLSVAWFVDRISCESLDRCWKPLRILANLKYVGPISRASPERDRYGTKSSCQGLSDASPHHCKSFHFTNVAQKLLKNSSQMLLKICSKCREYVPSVPPTAWFPLKVV